MFLIAGIAALIWAPGAKAQDSAGFPPITEVDCAAAKLGDSIPVTAIGEPVSAVNLNAPQWTPGDKGQPGYCSIKGAMAPIDHAPTPNGSTFRWRFLPSGMDAPLNWAVGA